jgi:P-type Ca2+ transporter type 2C
LTTINEMSEPKNNPTITQTPFHSQSTQKILLNIGSNKNGLTQAAVNEKLITEGKNIIYTSKSTNYLKLFIEQFTNPLVIILILVAIAAYFLGKTLDSAVIGIILLLNGILGFWQELKAQLAVDSLSKLLVPTARVLREGIIEQIDSSQLVNGDILLLEEGDKIAADARLIQHKNLITNESILTGESAVVSKNLELLPEITDLADRKNMVWSGTFVASGTGQAVVIATGLQTSLGQIAQKLQSVSRPSQFKIKINQLGKQISLLALVLATINFVLALWLGNSLAESTFFAISALVSGIPEGLPAILTLVLAIGAKQMSDKKAIVRKLEATEIIGSATVIATDKTGTLTTNTMTVQKILTSHRQIDVTGQGWSLTGDFLSENKTAKTSAEEDKLLLIASLCHKAKVEIIDEQVKVIGDPTEAGLYVLGRKVGLSKDSLVTDYQILDDLAFNSNSKMRASVIRNESNATKELYVVGAAEQVLEKCRSILEADNTESAIAKSIDNWHQQINDLSKQGYRVLALAYKAFDNNEVQQEDLEELTLVGFVAMQDPLRLEVVDSVKEAKRAGIRVIMMTGDHRATAQSIAYQAGIIDSPDELAYSEQDLAKLSDQELEKVVKECNVFARCTPDRKLQILQILQSQQQVVVMTGDGVNDGPALKQADVGVAMGLNGTDIARDSSEIILADDNFGTIVHAVSQGRVIFENIQKAVHLSVGRTLAGMLSLIGITVLIGALPFSSIQLLWLNLVTETIIGITLAFESGDGREMQRKPNSGNLLESKTMLLVLLNSAVATILTVGSYYWLQQNVPAYAGSAAFLVLFSTQLLSLLNFRSWTKPFWSGWTAKANPILVPSLAISVIAQLLAIYSPLNSILGFKALPINLLIWCVLFSSLILITGQVGKKLIMVRS